MPASQTTNEEIAELFEHLGMMLEMKGDSAFKIRAYQRAARTIEELSFPLDQAVADGQKLTGIPGIGKAISEKIHELVTTGQVQTFERVKSELPEGALNLLAIPGIGPKTAVLIGTELGISTIEGVEQAAQDGRLASLPRMGKRAADSILRHIRASRSISSDRTPIGQALSIAEAAMAGLRERDAEISILTPAGSLRRWEETIGDVDLVAITPQPEELGRCLAELPQVREVLVNGPRKTSVIVDPGLQIDLRTGEAESIGAMLQYFTGSQQHNIRLRDFANRMGLSLNEYGITNVESGQVEVFPDEESFYARLGLPLIPPELRAGMWELEAAIEGRLPQLVEPLHLRGDLHLHSDWSDGSDPIETMVATVASMGYEYMALTDHSQGLGVANGLTPDRLAAQREVLRQLQERYDIRILAGSEVDIRSDGRMDFPDEVLAELDVVVASVHNAMSQDRETMTRRVIRAMEHPSVTIIGHLSTRLLGQRPPTDFDLEAVLQAARDTGTALEINASPERLDLKDTHAYRARELGIPLVISTDSHHHSHLSGGRFGVAVARRAWCEPQHILNTMPLDHFRRFITTPKPQRIKVFDDVVATAAPSVPNGHASSQAGA
ncbi:DNA polymerase/3'-5' exonuclease PolX [Geodia barretti]|uniref:DNA-directed DNA polymerase n=1 Tax=Geodia barretti TaxID=519541 RepID=A0AA35WJK6_GEOBA|nr:DNA polymerase/3'-5' exonuclease PolX [Geodia barretti]